MKTARVLWVVAAGLSWIPMVSAGEGEVLMELDRRFDAETAVKGAAGWTSFFAENGTMQMGDAPPIVGREAIRKATEPVFGRPGTTLRWTPAEAGLWVPGKLGYTKGTYRNTSKDKSGKAVVRTGTYVTVWKKSADGRWQVLFDTGVPDESMIMTIRFKARVEEVKMLSRYEGEVRPVHVDPRYVIVVRVESVSPEGKGIRASQRIAFAIHSPARTFHGDRAEGNTYAFSIEREEAGGAVRWRALSVDVSGAGGP
jgi:ketosteroid isomerase-like protein